MFNHEYQVSPGQNVFHIKFSELEEKIDKLDFENINTLFIEDITEGIMIFTLEMYLNAKYEEYEQRCIANNISKDLFN